MANKTVDQDTCKKDAKKAQAKRNKDAFFVENEVTETMTEDQKTQKARRINMAFTDENYDYLLKETNRLSVSIVYYINTIISSTDEEKINEYIEKLPVRRSKDHVSRQKGNKVKRINLKFENNVHNLISSGAKKYNMTMTQYVNTIVETSKNTLNTR